MVGSEGRWHNAVARIPSPADLFCGSYDTHFGIVRVADGEVQQDVTYEGSAVPDRLKLRSRKQARCRGQACTQTKSPKEITSALHGSSSSRFDGPKCRKTQWTLDPKRDARPGNRHQVAYLTALKNLKPGVTEFVIHPGCDDDELRAATRERSTWGSAWRERDYDFFTSDQFREILAQQKLS
jgi:hypothetical protein